MITFINTSKWNSFVTNIKQNIIQSSIPRTLNQIQSDIAKAPPALNEALNPNYDSQSCLNYPFSSLMSYQFWGYKISSYSFPNCETIPQYCFYSNKSIVSFYAPKCIKVESEAFNRANIPNNVVFSNLQYVGDRAFYCTKIQNINIDDIGYIGASAFYATSISNINCSECTYIGQSAFAYCSSLQEVNLGLIDSISRDTFVGASNLSKVSLPNLKRLYYGAFKDCTNLKYIYAPKLEEIYSNAFSWCCNLESIDVNNCTYIGPSVFQRCSKLSALNFKKLTSMGSSGCNYCTGLQTVSFSICSYFYEDAFRGCSNLKEVYLMSTRVPTMIGDIFYGCSNLTSIFVRRSLIYKYQAATGWSQYSNLFTGLGNLVTFDAIGPSVSISSQEVVDGETIVPFSYPTVQHWTFSRAYYIQDSQEIPFEQSMPIYNDLNVKVKYDKAKYIVDFIPTSGLGVSIPSQTVEAFDTVVPFEYPSVTGYDRQTPYYIEGGSHINFDQSMQISKNLSVYVDYTKHLYTVSFQTTGASAYIAPQSVPYQETVVPFEYPSIHGYTFDRAYYIENEQEIAYSQTMSITKDMLVYINYNALPIHTVSFEGVGATISIPSQSVIHGDAIEPVTYPTISGYTFEKAYYIEGSTEIEFDQSMSITKDIHVYVKYNEIPVIKYTVNFYNSINRTKQTEPCKTFEVQEGQTVPTFTPSEISGYSYVNMIYEATEEVYSFDDAIESNENILINYTSAISHTVNFYKVLGESEGEGELYKTVTVPHECTVTPFNPPVVSGWDFISFIYNFDNYDEYNFDDPIITDTNVYMDYDEQEEPEPETEWYEIYWMDGSQTGHYDENQIDWEEQEVEEGEVACASNWTPTDIPEGYGFVGWYLDSALTNPVSWDDNDEYNLFSETTYFYAKFTTTAGKHKVIFKDDVDYEIVSVQYVEDGGTATSFEWPDRGDWYFDFMDYYDEESEEWVAYSFSDPIYFDLTVWGCYYQDEPEPEEIDYYTYWMDGSGTGYYDDDTISEDVTCDTEGGTWIQNWTPDNIPEGYSFDGWYLDSGLTNPVPWTEEDDDYYIEDTDTYFYAKFLSE